jgi:galactose oxidase-like protein/Kelch motif protein
LPLILMMVLAALLLVATGCPENVVDTDVDDPDIEPPQAVFEFTAKTADGQVRLTWESPEYVEDSDDNDQDGEEDDDVIPDPVNKDLEGMLIVRGLGQYPNALPAREDEYIVGDPLGAGAVIAVLHPLAEEFVDTDVEIGQTYFYEAITFDKEPNYGSTARAVATPGSMVWARLAHTQTNLADGRVLLAGGIDFAGPLDRGELYDPSTGAFEAIVDEMQNERFGHTATQLVSGDVLIIGGYEAGFAQTVANVEYYDVEDGFFRWINDEMALGRALQSATLLPDGRVLVAGGTDGVNALKTVEMFDPADGTFAMLDDQLWRARYGHQAAVIGEFVIIFGGFDGYATVPYATSVRLDDLRIASLTNIGYEETPMVEGRLNATLTELDDGRWLIAGGFSGPLESGFEIDTAEIFDPDGDPYFTATGSLNQARSGHRAIELGDGTVLVVGGISPDDTILDSAELFDPATETFAEIGSMHTPRTVPEVSLLPDGTVLITGGNSSIDLFDPQPASTAEIYDPATQTFAVVGAP